MKKLFLVCIAVGCASILVAYASIVMADLDLDLTGIVSDNACRQTEQKPVMTTTPTSKAFGNVSSGSTRTQVFTVSNTGRGTITGIQARMSSAGMFRVYSSSGTTAPMTFKAKYAPTTVASHTNAIYIDNDQFTSTRVPLSGTGTTATVCDGSSATGLLVYQNFEGTGYDNSETWTETVGTSGAVDENDTTATVLRGSEQLKIVAGGTQSTTRKSITASSTVYAHFLFQTPAYPASLARIWTMENAAQSAQTYLQLNTTGKLRLNHGTQVVETSAALSLDTKYHVWVRYTKGTGTDGVYSVAFSTTGTAPTSGTQYAAGTNGTSTADIEIVRINAYNAMTHYFDQILAKTTALEPICD